MKYNDQSAVHRFLVKIVYSLGHRKGRRETWKFFRDLNKL